MRKTIANIKKLGFELLVIFIGMTAAIALDNYRQDQFLRKEEKELLNMMIGDLNKDISNLKKLITYDSTRVEGQVGTTKYFKSERFSYNSLFESQRVNLISNNNLRVRIFKYYELCDEIDEHNKKFLTLEEQITKYLVENNRDLALYSMIDSDSIPHYALLLKNNNFNSPIVDNYRTLHNTLLDFKNHYQKRIKREATLLVYRIEASLEE